MNLNEWNVLTPLERKLLASKYGISLKGKDELINEKDLEKVPEIMIVEPYVDIAIDPVLDKEIKIKYEKPTKKLAAKKPVKKVASLGNGRRPVSKPAKRKKS